MRNSVIGVVVAALALSVAGHANAADGKAVYSSACAMCHATGAMGAPKTGDKARWAPLIKTGMDSLYNSTLKGKGTMPPKGGKADLSDADVKAAVDYMVTQSK
ncbi:MAG: cytochrome c5 family protein [Gammaproteobacteria bacterium]|nr:cytochrome c5 family protein [Gammaproteobacteria bacterium]